MTVPTPDFDAIAGAVEHSRKRGSLAEFERVVEGPATARPESISDRARACWSRADTPQSEAFDKGR